MISSYSYDEYSRLIRSTIQNGQDVVVEEYESEYVKEAGRGHTGRTTENDIVEQMAMDDARRNPFNLGDGKEVKKIIDELGDIRWKGWQKWQIVYRTN